MVNIALVEDSETYTKELLGYLERYGEESGESLKISTFSDGDEIALNYKAGYDIILMDIEMKFMDGMTAAEEIRKKDKEVVIIFITNMPQYAIKGYAVDALDYVLKPVSYYAFSQRLDRALQRMKKRAKKYIVVPMQGGTCKIDISQIYYVEVQHHDLVFHTTEGQVLSSGSIKSVEEAIGNNEFFRCNKGYLVNLAHVKVFQDDFALVGGDRVQVSRAKKKAFLDALNNFISEVEK